MCQYFLMQMQNGLSSEIFIVNSHAQELYNLINFLLLASVSPYLNLKSYYSWVGDPPLLPQTSMCNFLLMCLPLQLDHKLLWDGTVFYSSVSSKPGTEHGLQQVFNQHLLTEWSPKSQEDRITEWLDSVLHGVHMKCWPSCFPRSCPDQTTSVETLWPPFPFLSFQFSRSVVSDSATPWIAARQASLSITNSQSSPKLMCIKSVMPAISSSVVPFSSCPQSLPASGSFPMSQLFTWGGQSIGVSALASVLPMNTQDWSPLGWTNWISLQSKDSQESSPTPQFKSINYLALSFLHSPILISIHDHRKNHSLD